MVRSRPDVKGSGVIWGGRWELMQEDVLGELMPVRSIAGWERRRNGGIAGRAIGSHSRALRREGAGSVLGAWRAL